MSLIDREELLRRLKLHGRRKDGKTVIPEWMQVAIKEVEHMPEVKPSPFTGNISDFFYLCYALENITITGTIQNTGFDLHWSTKLTIESLTSILTALSKNSSVAAGKSITFPTAAQAKIQANTTAKGQYDAAIAAGWTIAFS